MNNVARKPWPALKACLTNNAQRKKVVLRIKNRYNAASNAPVAQLDRVVGFEPIGREFESLRARHFSLQTKRVACAALFV